MTLHKEYLFWHVFVTDLLLPVMIFHIQKKICTSKDISDKATKKC